MEPGLKKHGPVSEAIRRSRKHFIMDHSIADIQERTRHPVLFGMRDDIQNEVGLTRDDEIEAPVAV
jgi:hypothetical protein